MIPDFINSAYREFTLQKGFFLWLSTEDLNFMDGEYGLKM
jgi:hypothetical protein